MGIDLTKLDKSGFIGWGAIVAMSFTNEARRIANMPASELSNVDLTNLKKQISDLEELQVRAKELGLTIYGKHLK